MGGGIEMPTEYVCQDEATEIAFYGQYKDNPSQVAAGVYDFSGTGTPITFQRCDDQAVSFNVTPDEIANLKSLWWDGSSAAWTTDAEFDVCSVAVNSSPRSLARSTAYSRGHPSATRTPSTTLP